MRAAQLDTARVVGAWMLLGGALLAFAALTLPGRDAGAPTAYAAATLMTAGLGLALLRTRLGVWERAPLLVTLTGGAGVTLGLLYGGESNGQQPTLVEAYYLWPALYAGYFCSRGEVAIAFATTIAAYTGALLSLDVAAGAFGWRWTTAAVTIAGAVVLAQRLRRHTNWLRRRTVALAHTDPMTGLLNNRAFDDHLASELARARRTRDPVTLLVGDLDHLGAINRGQGRDVGDGAMLTAADAVRNACRGMDAAGRVGDGFGVLLVGANVNTALVVADRTRLGVSDGAGGAGNGTSLTMSFGIAEFGRHGATADDLLAAANRALRTAKARGRNRSFVAGDLDEPR